MRLKKDFSKRKSLLGGSLPLRLMVTSPGASSTSRKMLNLMMKRKSQTPKSTRRRWKNKLLNQD